MNLNSCGKRRAYRRQAGAMAEEIVDGQGSLACLGEFGPVLRNRRPEIQLTAVGEDESAEGGHGFRCRIDVDDRVFLPGFRSVVVRDAPPEVNDRLAAQGDRDRRAYIQALVEVGGKRFADCFESREEKTAYVSMSQSSPQRS